MVYCQKQRLKTVFEHRAALKFMLWHACHCLIYLHEVILLYNDRVSDVLLVLLRACTVPIINPWCVDTATHKSRMMYSLLRGRTDHACRSHIIYVYMYTVNIAHF